MLGLRCLTSIEGAIAGMTSNNQNQSDANSDVQILSLEHSLMFRGRSKFIALNVYAGYFGVRRTKELNT